MSFSITFLVHGSGDGAVGQSASQSEARYAAYERGEWDTDDEGAEEAPEADEVVQSKLPEIHPTTT